MNNPVMFVDPSGEIALPAIPIGKGLAELLRLIFGIGVAYGSAQSISNWSLPNAGAAGQALRSQSAGGVSALIPSVDPLIAAAVAVAYMESQDVRDWVRAQISTRGINSNSFERYSVYVLHNPDRNDEVFYVGMSSSPDRRLTEHRRDPRFADIRDIQMTTVITNLSRFNARATEQILITAFTLDALFNKINSITMRKWHEANAQFERMQTLIMRR